MADENVNRRGALAALTVIGSTAAGVAAGTASASPGRAQVDPRVPSIGLARGVSQSRLADLVEGGHRVFRSDGHSEAGIGDARYALKAGSADTAPGDLRSRDGVALELAEAEVSPEMFGAKGDGVQDDTDPWIAAVSSGRPVRPRPGAVYLISRPIKSPRGRALVINGGSARGEYGATLRAGPTLRGYVLMPSGSYDVRGVRIEGNRAEGCFLFGSDEEGEAGFAILDTVDLRFGDILINFGAAWQHPLGLSYDRIYGMGFRTAGIVLGGRAGPARTGESAWHFGQVIMTNHGTNSVSGGVSAQGVQVASTGAVDAITWDNAGLREFGWVVMRSANGRTNWHVPPNWPPSIQRGNRFEAARKPGEKWTYRVVRQTVGCSIRRAKAFAAAVIQVEYCGIGLLLEEVFGFNVQTLYHENRDRAPLPLPSVAALIVDHSFGCLGTAWIEGSSYGIACLPDAMLDVGIARGNDLHWSLFATTGSGEGQLEFRRGLATGSTSAELRRF